MGLAELRLDHGRTDGAGRGAHCYVQAPHCPHCFPELCRLHFFSDRRLVLIKGVPLQGLEAGQYQLEVEIEDRIRNEKIAVQEDFRVVSG